MTMDTRDHLPKDAVTAAWQQPGSLENAFVVQGNPAGLEALAKLLTKLAREHNGAKVKIDRAAGLKEGDAVLVLQRMDVPLPPPNPELAQTRVEVPDEGDSVAWLTIPDAARDAAAQILVNQAGYTTLQARETVGRRHVGLRMGLALANRLRDLLRKAGVEVELFHSA